MAEQVCPLCQGMGWRLVERVDANAPAQRVVERQNARPGISTAPPKITWAVPCECTSKDRETQAQVRARIPRRYEHCDLENFDTNLWDSESGYPQAPTWNRSLAQAKVVVEAFAKNYPAGGETGLLLMGPCGAGKTHLAVAALRKLMQRGHEARFYDYRELLKEIQSSYDPNNPVSETSVLAPVFESEVILIDDLGASKPSPWAMETMGHILNKRYNEKRVTLLTTNYLDTQDNPSGAAPRLPSGQTVAPSREDSLTDRLGQRVRSRLYEMCRTIEISSADYRREIRQAGRVRS